MKGYTLYVTLFPCNECAKVIIQSGIKKVVFLSDVKKDKEEYKIAKKLFDTAHVEYRYAIQSYHLRNIKKVNGLNHLRQT